MSDYVPTDADAPDDPYEEEIVAAALPPRRGNTAEERLLGALLQAPRELASIRGRTRGAEFASPALGAVFDALSTAIARGETVTVETIAARFPEWNIRGLSGADPFDWDTADVLPYLATEYASTVRDTYLRREGERILLEAHRSMHDTGLHPLTVASAALTALSGLIDVTVAAEAGIEPLRAITEREHAYEWVIPGMLERGDRLVLTGSEGGGKTTLLRQIALCSAAGLHPLLGFAMPPRRVLVVDAENSEAQWKRAAVPLVHQIQAYSHAVDPRDRTGLVLTKRIDLSRPADLAMIHRHVDEWKPDVLMIGPLYRLVPHAITNDDHAAPLLTALDSLRDRGLALLLEAHAGKSTDGDGDRNMAPRGSSALMGWPEFGFGLRPVKADPSMVSVVAWRGARDGERPWPRHLRRGGRLPWSDADPQQ